MSEAQSNKKNINLDVVRVLDLGCGILQQAFFKQPEEKAKAILKDLKHGKSIGLGSMTLNNKSSDGEGSTELGSIPLSLELDYSEFKGPGFSFPVYKVALKAMMDRIAQTVRAKKDLNILTNQQTGGMLIHQPGVIQVGEQINVMLLTIESAGKGGIKFKLIFVDPEQYKTKDVKASA